MVSILQTYSLLAHVFNHYINSLFPWLCTCPMWLLHKHFKIIKMLPVLSPILLHSSQFIFRVSRMDKFHFCLSSAWPLTFLKNRTLHLCDLYEAKCRSIKSYLLLTALARVASTTVLDLADATWTDF